MTPDFASYDLIVINTSGGKDSQAALDETIRHTDAAGIDRSRIIAVHADLGRVEWEGTVELAAEQVGHYGLRFEIVRNRNWADLLERIEDRGKWPDMATRYCTSEFKTGQVRRLMTELVRDVRSQRGDLPNGRNGAPVRILNVLGLRAQESPRRSKLEPFTHDALSSNTKRHVDQWLPIHGWAETQVWDRINETGVPYHRAYDLGMPRLSCTLCVFGSKSALTIGIRNNPNLARDYAAAERRMGHLFRKDFSIADFVDDVLAPETTIETPVSIEDWAA